MHSIDSSTLLKLAGDTCLRVCNTRIIDLVLPRATEVVYSYPESFELLRLIDMDHEQVSNALYRALYSVYASGRYLSQTGVCNTSIIDLVLPRATGAALSDKLLI